MKTTRTLAFFAGIAVSACAFAAPHAANPAFTPLDKLQPDEYMANTIIINMLPEYRNACAANQINIPALNDFFLMIGADRVEKMFPLHKAPAKSVNEWGAPMEDISLIYTIHYTGAMPLTMCIGKMFNMGYFEYAQPYYIPKVDFTPNDPSASNASSYYLYKIYAASTSGTSGWDISTGSSSVTIGIVDTGTELTHSDLVNKIQYNTADPLSGGDDDNDGFVNNYRGWDVAMNDNDPTWQGNQHGVHVCGCAAAELNNNIMVAGSGGNCRFLPVKIADASGTLTASYQGITYAADHGCDVINCSWGGTGGGSFEQSIIDYATNNCDAIVVAAAGNNALDEMFYPAALDKVMSVGSTTSSDSKSNFSNYNYTVDIAAPGSNILSTWPTNTTTLNSGTSMASPVCAGALAIVRSFYPSYNCLQAGERLKMTSDVVGAQTSYPNKMGKGRVNLYRALTDPASISVAYLNRALTDNNDNTFVIGDTIRCTGDFMNYLGATTNLVATMSVVTPGGYVTVLDGTTNPGAIATMASIGHSADPFTIKINPSAPLNQTITLKVTLTDGAWTTDQYFDIVVNVDYINIAINDVATSITSKGLIGYNTQAAPFLGLGFLYNNTSLMYEMSFMVGTSSNVRDMARGATTPDVDLQSTQTVRENVPATVSDMDVEGYFSDGASASPLPVTVHHYAYAWTAAPSRKYVMVKYVIRNTGASTLTNVYSGIFADWDIDAATYGSNKGDVDNTNRMGYCYYSGANGTYAGIKLLSNGGFNHYAIDNTNGGSGGVNLYDGYDNAEKWTTLSTNRAQSGITSTPGNDVCQVVSSGPFTIAAGDSVVVGFAILAGDNLADLQASAADAQINWNNITTGISVAANDNTGVNVYPNPANASAEVAYSMTENGNVNIGLYDAAGRKVAQIAQGARTAGTYRETLNTGTLPEGIYTIRMEAGNAIINRRLVITH
jgi:serine protease